jgi:putative ABC transport system permease protein
VQSQQILRPGERRDQVPRCRPLWEGLDLPVPLRFAVALLVGALGVTACSGVKVQQGQVVKERTRYRFGEPGPGWRQLSLTVKPRDLSLIRQTMDDATVALRIARHLRPKQPDNFGLFTADTILDIYNSATSGIFAVLVGVVGLSLVVGGIVIMNIMLMVVSERTREIGLRKALGARKRDIVWQILTESTTLSVAGGLVGTLLGFAAALIIAQLTPLPAKVELWAIALGIGMTAVVGLFFGLYPAIRAASLDPIEALRRE